VTLPHECFPTGLAQPLAALGRYGNVTDIVERESVCPEAVVFARELADVFGADDIDHGI